MFKVNKKLSWGVFVFLGLIILGYSFSVVDAIGVEVKQDADKTYVCFNKSDGTFKDTAKSAAGCKDRGYGQSSVKIINNDYAYCVNWGLKFRTESKYEVVSTWKDTSENAIKAGYLINLIQDVNSNKYDVNKAYSNTAATLNTLFATKEKDSGSYDFSENKEFSGYLKSADTYYMNIKDYMNNVLSKPTINVDGSTVLSYNDSTNKYFSGKVTISNLYKTYGGDNDTVTYKVSVKSGNNNVSICSDAKGANCQAGEVTVSGKNTYSFYVFVDKDVVSEGDSIVINISGSNKSTYYSSVLYDDTTYEYTQKLITKKEISYSRSTSASSTLVVPVLNNHTIDAYKVDEHGDEICGATLEIYRDDPKGENINNRIATNIDDDDNNDCRVKYISDTVIEEDDDFYNHDYYLIERNAPDGFVLSDEVRHFKPENKLSLACYETVDGELKSVDDMEFCYPEKYDYMCKNNNNPDDIKAPVNGNCPISEEGGDVSPNAIPEGGVTTNSVYSKVCYDITDPNNLKEANNAYCLKDKNYTKVWNGNGNVTVRQLNVRNVVNISKMDITNKKEVIGASLKICTKEDYDKDNNNCKAATTVDGIEMAWISDDVPYNIYGIKAGEYYIIEEIPPKGYLKATTAIKFSIDKYGKVITDNKTITNNDFIKNNAVIVVDNDITNITISKQDIATKKELPGASLSICESYKDEETNEIKMKVDQYTDECIEVILANGKKATWESTDKPKVIEGLNPGTYYLVEKIAPANYNAAESILFTLKDDGSLVDKDGKSLKDNKIIMYDEIIEEKKTGSLSIYIVVGTIISVSVLGIGTYYYLRQKKVNGVD